MTRELCRDTIRTSTYMALFGPPPLLEGPQISRQDQMYRWNPTRGNPQNILIKWANSPFLVIFKLSNLIGALRVLRSGCSQSLKNLSQKYIMLSIFLKLENQSYFSLNLFLFVPFYKFIVRLLYRTVSSFPLWRAKISFHFYFNHLHSILILLDRYNVYLKLFRS